MSIAAKMDKLIDLHAKHRELLECNHVLIDMFDGNLHPYIRDALKKQLGPKSAAIAAERIPPFNLLKRVTDKLSKIYDTKTTRNFEGDADGTVLSEYLQSMGGNRVFNSSNEYFNMFKYSLLQPINYKGMPKLRAVPNDKFLVWSTDETMPSVPDGVLLLMGKCKGSGGSEVEKYMAYDSESIFIFDSEKNVYHEEMAAKGNPDGVNPLGRLPFVYVNRSESKLIPTQDSDLKAMSILIPVLASDLNYAIMFQAFSIIYGIDVDDKDIEWGPRAFMRFKTDPNTETTPSVGVIKPEVDIGAVKDWIITQLALWLQTRGIRPGSVDGGGAESFSSGVSKIIDEMDTSEERTKQVNYYQAAERDLWELEALLHESWKSNGSLSPTIKGSWPKDAKVITNFAEQVPNVRRSEMVNTIKAEIELGIEDRKGAMRRLEPHMTPAEIDAKLAAIDEEKKARAAAFQTPKKQAVDEESDEEEVTA